MFHPVSKRCKGRFRSRGLTHCRREYVSGVSILPDSTIFAESSISEMGKSSRISEFGSNLGVFRNLSIAAKKGASGRGTLALAMIRARKST